MAGQVGLEDPFEQGEEREALLTGGQVRELVVGGVRGPNGVSTVSPCGGGCGGVR